MKKEGFAGKPTHRADFPAKEEGEMLLDVQSLFFLLCGFLFFNAAYIIHCSIWRLFSI